MFYRVLEARPYILSNISPRQLDIGQSSVELVVSLGNGVTGVLSKSLSGIDLRSPFKKKLRAKHPLLESVQPDSDRIYAGIQRSRPEGLGELRVPQYWEQWRIREEREIWVIKWEHIHVVGPNRGCDFKARGNATQHHVASCSGILLNLGPKFGVLMAAPVDQSS